MQRLASDIEIIEQGQIAVGTEQKLENYILRMLTPEDLPEIMALQDGVVSSLAQKEYYVPLSEAEITFILAGGGESLGLFIQEKLYGACSLLYSVADEDNMARKLNFDKKALSKVAQLELSLVDSHVRGNKMQCKMAAILIDRLQEKGRARYIFTTVSPYNYASVQTVTTLGLQIASLDKMYFDWDRYIVYRDLLKPVLLDTHNPISVINTALDKQKELLQDGYRGFAQYKDEKGTMILYGKVL